MTTGKVDTVTHDAAVSKLVEAVGKLAANVCKARENCYSYDIRQCGLWDEVAAAFFALSAPVSAEPAKGNNLPCSLCREIVKEEFVVPSDIWNAVVRPNGRETDKEYLCLDCWYVSLRKWMVSHGLVQQQDRHEVDVLVPPREVVAHPRDCACETAGGIGQESCEGQAADVRDRCGVRVGGAEASSAVKPTASGLESAEAVADKIAGMWYESDEAFTSKVTAIISARDAAWQAKSDARVGGLQKAWAIEYENLLRDIREKDAEIARLNGEHTRACQTIAAMHAAAVGEVRGPIRGIVEDVADLRTRLSAAGGVDRELLETARALMPPLIAANPQACPGAIADECVNHAKLLHAALTAPGEVANVQ